MTPLLQHLLKLPAATSLVKIEQREGAKKIQEVYFVTEKASPTEEVWEHEVVVEEHAEVLYEDEVAPVGETILLLSEAEKPSQRDKKSELRGEISVTDASRRKETRVKKQRVVPKTKESILVVQGTQSEKGREDKLTKEKTEEEFFVRTVESPTEEVTDERKDSTSVRHQEVSEHETTVTVKKGRAITIKTESKERTVREQEVTKTQETSIKEIELVKDAGKIKPSPPIISTESRKQTQKLEIEGKALIEESIDHDVEIISAIPDEKYYRTEEITVQSREVTVKDKTTKVIPTKETSKQEETQIKPPVVPDKKDEITAPGKVSAKKHELQETKVQSDEITEKSKPKVEVTAKSKAEVKPKESVTDIELQKPKVIEQETESAKYDSENKKKEESKDVPLQREQETSLIVKDKPSIPSKPEEKKRISQKAASRGKSNIIIFIFNSFI